MALIFDLTGHQLHITVLLLISVTSQVRGLIDPLGCNVTVVSFEGTVSLNGQQLSNATTSTALSCQQYCINLPSCTAVEFTSAVTSSNFGCWVHTGPIGDQFDGPNTTQYQVNRVCPPGVTTNTVPTTTPTTTTKLTTPSSTTRATTIYPYTWVNGTWVNGTWVNGTWSNGAYINGTWYNASGSTVYVIGGSTYVVPVLRGNSAVRLLGGFTASAFAVIVVMVTSRMFETVES